MTMKTAIEEIEAKMAEMKATIDAMNVKVDPLREELNALHAEAAEVQVRIDAKAAQLQAARGDGAAWLKLKRDYGMLAATRMQMREAQKAL